MANPIVHTLAIIAAIIIPGGLLVYFGWRGAKKAAMAATERKEEAAHKSTLLKARAEFRKMYPKDSLRARSRWDHLRRAKAYRRKKSPE
jgi:hypothetical protein